MKNDSCMRIFIWVIRFAWTRSNDNSERFKNQLIKVTDVLEQKCAFTGSETRQVITQHDNARPY